MDKLLPVPLLLHTTTCLAGRAPKYDGIETLLLLEAINLCTHHAEVGIHQRSMLREIRVACSGPGGMEGIFGELAPRLPIESWHHGMKGGMVARRPAPASTSQG